MSSPLLPFIDFPAPGKLTVRLELDRVGTMLLYVYWGGDPVHTLGTDDVFAWDGEWIMLKKPTRRTVSPEEILDFMVGKLTWNDLSDRSISDFLNSGVLESAVSSAPAHHLAMTVMSS